MLVNRYGAAPVIHYNGLPLYRYAGEPLIRYAVSLVCRIAGLAPSRYADMLFCQQAIAGQYGAMLAIWLTGKAEGH